MVFSITRMCLFLGISSWMCWVTEIGKERMYSAPSSSSASPSDTVRGEWRRTWPTKRKTWGDFKFLGVQNVVFIDKRVHVVIHTACVYSCDVFFFKLLKPCNSKFIRVLKKTYEPKIVDTCISKLIYISLKKGSYLG